MKKILKKLFKIIHIHIWHNNMNEGLYAEGFNSFYRCRCGAIKSEYMAIAEQIIED